jgi:hypothetical protein
MCASTTGFIPGALVDIIKSAIYGAESSYEGPRKFSVEYFIRHGVAIEAVVRTREMVTVVPLTTGGRQ